MLRLKILFILISLVPLIGSAQEKVPEGVPLAFKAGNAEALSEFFNEDIELVILEEEDVYSRKQAEQIMRKFFTDHRPSAFKIIFEGGKETSRYAIGSLNTENGVFRIYLLIKEQDNQPLIHQLRIEEEEDDQKV